MRRRAARGAINKNSQQTLPGDFFLLSLWWRVAPPRSFFRFVIVDGASGPEKNSLDSGTFDRGRALAKLSCADKIYGRVEEPGDVICKTGRVNVGNEATNASRTILQMGGKKTCRESNQISRPARCAMHVRAQSTFVFFDRAGRDLYPQIWQGLCAGTYGATWAAVRLYRNAIR